MRKLDFEYKEREVKVTVVKNQAVTKQLVKRLNQVQAVYNPETAADEPAAETEHQAYRVDKQVNVPVVRKEYQSSSKPGKPRKIEQKNNSGFDERDFNFDIDKELEALDTSPIHFENGEYRKILVDLAAEFKKLNFLAATVCRVRIIIDETGAITGAQILESTGELENDNKIIALVKMWKFETSSLPRQTAIVEMRYYFR